MSLWKPVASHNPQAREERQVAMLRRFLSEQIIPFHPFYRGLYKEHGFKPQHLKTFEDLKNLPLTTKADFLPTDANPQGYRSFILQPTPELIREHWPKTRLAALLAKKVIFGSEAVKDDLQLEYKPVLMTATTGRSAEPVSFLYTKHDIDRLEEAGERLLDIFNITSDDRVVNMFPYAPHLAFWQTALAGLSRGVLVLSTGGGKVMGTAGNIRAIDRMKPSLIIGMPGYTYHLLRVAANEEHDFSSVTKVVLGAEKVTQGMKDKMTALLEQMGSKKPLIFGTYGFTEARMAWGECPAAPGISSGYHTYPDMEIFEVIDPDTGEHVGEGEDGELVYTTLNARGSCVVRYRTGDLARGGIVTNQCPYCGRNVPRISSDITRVSNVKELKATKIKGTLVNLNSIGEVLSSNKVVDEWQVEIGKRNNDPFELDELVLNISLQQGAEREPATDRLKEELRLATELTPSRINVLSLNDMLTKLGMETELKERRIVDKRPNN